MSDNVAVLDGYTKEVHVVSQGKELFLLVKPNTDFTEQFRAWDMDQQEYIIVQPFNLKFK